MAKEEIRIEYKPLGSLARNPRNPKGHDIPTLKASMRRFGFVQPLLSNEADEIMVAGHGRLEALLEMQRDGEPAPSRIRVAKDGSWHVPVLRGVSFKDEHEAAAYLLADNRLVELGGWDPAGLNEMLADLKQADSLEGVGWSAEEVDTLLAESKTERVRGPTPEERAEAYNAGVIKQIVLYFKIEEFDGILAKLQSIMDRAGVENHTAAFVWLLEQYGKAGSTASTG